MNDIQFELKDLSFTYPGGREPALKKISLTVRRGEFIVVCGASGCGKSTLLRLLKPELTPHGRIEGERRFFGTPEADFSFRDSAERIGFLQQDPEYQTVTHDVLGELAFGPENLGLGQDATGLRIAEIAAYFGLSELLEQKTSVLSGGKKQLLALAGVLTLYPRALLLDEPTSQLDPTAADSLLHTVTRLCRENGLTVIVSEHRLEQLLPAATRVLALENGELRADCPPRDLPRELILHNEFVRRAVPVSQRLHAALSLPGPAPLSVEEGRRMLLARFGGQKSPVPAAGPAPAPAENAVFCKDVWFAYDRSGYVLRGFSIAVPKGSFFALMGANAAGKSTALSVIAGALKPERGRVEALGQRLYGRRAADGPPSSALLGQQCEALFSAATLGAELSGVLRDTGVKKEERERRVQQVARFLEIDTLLDRHPYDVSGGEMQRAALGMILLRDPDLILLDEPTKGIDNVMKHKLAQKLLSLCKAGKTVVMVSHDTEFCAAYCTRCAMLFRGRVASVGTPAEFFSRHYFYTTAANKIARDVFPGAVTEEEVERLCREKTQG